MAEIEWTADAAIRLMEEYKQRPVLWDSTHEMYRVQTAKYEAWSELARLFQCDIADLRKKLNSIFASHRREKSKVRGGGVSTWFLYPYMRFMPSHLENETTHTRIISNTKEESATQTSSEESSQSSSSEEQQDDENREEMPILIKQESEVTNHIRRDNRKTIKRTITRLPINKPPLKRRLIKESNVNHKNLDSVLLETLKLVRNSNLSKKKDECDSFGEYIAISLRKHDERTQSMIKQAINNILFEQEMKKFNAGQYTVVISGIDDNPLIIGEEK